MKAFSKSAPVSIVGYVLLTVILTAGAAQSLAGTNTVDSGDIVDGTISTPDLKTGALSGSKILDNSVTSADVANGSLTGVDIADGSLGAADVGYVGPTASGHVSAAGDPSRLHGATVGTSKLATGQYCVEVEGAMPSTNVLVANIDYGESPTAAGSTFSGIVEAAQDSTCGAMDTGWTVRTFLHNDALNPSVAAFDAGFNFVVN
jgi:hypothetical protein